MQAALHLSIYRPKIITLPPSFKGHISKSSLQRPLTPERPPSPHLSNSLLITTTHNHHNSSFNTIKTYKIDLSKRTSKTINSLSNNDSNITTSSNTISKYSSHHNNISSFVYSNQNKIQNLQHHKKSIQLNRLIKATSQPKLQGKKKYPKFSLKTKLSKPSSNNKLNTTLYNVDHASLQQTTVKRERTLKNKEDEDKHYSYRRPSHLNCTYDKERQSVSFTQRQNIWKKKVEKKKKELSDINRNKEIHSCTFKPKINKGIHKHNNLNNIEEYTMKKKEVLNGMVKNGKRKYKGNGSCQRKKSDKGRYVKYLNEKSGAKEFVEKEDNSFWNEECLSRDNNIEVL